MRILALDLAGKTGWARWHPSMSAPAFGVMKLPQKGAFSSFRDFLITTVVNDGIEHIAVESVFIAQGMESAAPRLYGLMAHAEEIAFRRGIGLHKVMVSDWRQHFLGQRNAPKTIKKEHRREWLKKQAVDECRSRGWNVHCNDEADALGLLNYERARLLPEWGAEGELFGLASIRDPMGCERVQ